MKKSTIKDIAKEAGVANSTVTNAFNPNSKKISEKKRKEILEIANRLNYSPNKFAQSLSSKSKKRVGFFIRSSEHFNKGIIDQKLIYYMNKFALTYNIELITIFISYDQSKSFEEIKKQINSYNLSHMIIQGLDNDLEILSKIVNLNIPKILIELPIVNNNTVFISTDNFKAQFDLTTFIKKEHDIKNPIHITGTLNAYVSIERLRGYEKGCKHNNLPFNFIESSFDKETAFNIIKNIDFSPYDYISCGSDIIASLVAKTCINQNHLNVVISGFDGDDILSFFDFPMYTVNQDIEKICRNSLEMIINDALEIKLIDFNFLHFN